MNCGVKNAYGNNLLFAGFNQDQECLACATSDGFRIFSCEPLKEKGKQIFDSGGLGHVEMLFRSNYLALVGGGERPLYPLNRVMMWDDVQKKISMTLDFKYPVLGVRLRRDRIVVIMEKLIKVYTFTLKPELVSVFETMKNPLGLCLLCPNSDNALLAFPWIKTGHVQLVDLGRKDNHFIDIAAHESTITCMAFNLQGTRLATSSAKGTLIRVFDTKSGQMLAELRRGVNQATIYCINFNHASSYLCVSSDHGTIHIFALNDQKLNRQSTLANTGFLPSYFSSSWSFCKFTVPNGPKCICAFGMKDDCVLVFCADGWYYKFSYNMKGECTTEQSAQFLELPEEDI
ncbi:hypothetical protein WA026_011021 [Henosepilachna vigintioctopunctata]|uniref:WD repeat domain phosphoinositide-interacting protein 3 n=1 Tax=Henosepilachna vigintioctopunctata TaxID=420089 RepID=A0AAW1UYE3_9CUCU